jgi:hypothetical protein
MSDWGGAVRPAGIEGRVPPEATRKDNTNDW